MNVLPNRRLRTALQGAALGLALTAALPSEAACSGSGTEWSCTSGTSSAEIASALASAADGATLRFDAGTYTWNSFVSFSNAKGASLVCRTAGECRVTPRGTVLGMNGNLSGNNGHTYRISGFRFDGGGSGPTIWFYGAGTLSSLRIDHNTFTNYDDSATTIFLGENSTKASFYGVIDHNTLTNASNMMLVLTLGATPDPAPSHRGTQDNLFIEDNSLQFARMTNAGHGCLDGWGGNEVVFRKNQTLNCLVTQHGVGHAGGPSNFELYDNRISVDAGAGSFDDCTRCFHHQGSGEFIAFRNVFSATGGTSSAALAMTHYRSATSSAAGYPASMGRCDGSMSRDGRASAQGYPCWRQPGRDGMGNLQPMYVWGNKFASGRPVTMLIENPWGATNPSVQTHIQADRDYYNEVSSFDGRSGMGVGTRAQRPATCTANPNDAGGGVGYFATDENQLYRCTNNAGQPWVAHYKPFTYPHPAVSGSQPASSTALPPPGNVRVLN